jgi:hypothetical protein
MKRLSIPLYRSAATPTVITGVALLLMSIE